MLTDTAIDRIANVIVVIHRRAFTPDYQAVGKEFDENGICVLEKFELLYPGQKGSARDERMEQS